MAKGVQLCRGKYRARICRNGQVFSLPVCDTEEEAVALRAAAQEALTRPGVVPVFGTTLRQLSEAFLQDRAKRGRRDLRNDRNRWNRNVLGSSLADLPLKSITRADIVAWVDELSQRPPEPRHRSTLSCRTGRRARRVAHQTVLNARNLLSAAFEYALNKRLVTANPVRGVKVEKEPRTDEPWTYFEPGEQDALLQADKIPESERLLIGWQLGTGMRPSETASLRLADLHLGSDHPHAVVRFGKEGRAPKNGRIRQVELFGIALDAVTRWLEILPDAVPHNPMGLVWPRPSGCRRQDSRLIPRWHEHLGTAGVPQARIYDLRHTTASSMIAGWWGRVWTIAEVSAALGHSSLQMTMRYAHLGETALRAAAAETDRAAAQGMALVVAPWSRRKQEGDDAGGEDDVCEHHADDDPGAHDGGLGAHDGDGDEVADMPVGAHPRTCTDDVTVSASALARTDT